LVIAPGVGCFLLQEVRLEVGYEGQEGVDERGVEVAPALRVQLGDGVVDGPVVLVRRWILRGTG
jgi:hypothetical protein